MPIFTGVIFGTPRARAHRQRAPSAEYQLSSSHQIPVAAPHQPLAILDQTDDPRSKVMALPRAIFQSMASGQQHLRDVPIRLALELSIKRAEFKDQALSPEPSEMIACMKRRPFVHEPPQL